MAHQPNPSAQLQVAEQKSLPLGLSMYSEKNSEAYEEIIGVKLPDVKDMPETLDLPVEITDYLKSILDLQEQHSKEHVGYVYVDNNGRKNFTLPKLGNKTNAFIFQYMTRSLMRAPALAFIHSHPSDETDPSSLLHDLGVFENNPNGAKMCIVVAAGATYMILDTAESPKLPISSLHNASKTVSTLNSKIIDATNKIDFLFQQLKYSFDMNEMIDEAIRALMAEVCELNGKVMYELKGDIRNTEGKASFRRLSVNFPNVEQFMTNTE